MPVKVIGTLPFPAGRLHHSSCISMDFGGSVVKIVYKDKRDSQNVPGKIKLKIISFAREEYKEAMEYLKERADIRTPAGSKPVLYCTGIGGTQHGQELEEGLDVTLKNMAEADAFVKGMNVLLTSFPKEDVIVPTNEDIERKATDTAEKMVAMMTGVMEKGHIGADLKKPSPSKPNKEGAAPAAGKVNRAYADTENLFPCMLASLGSAFGTLSVKKDGSYAVEDACLLGGRSYLGLGSLLTGAKTYEELMALAEKGDERRIHSFSGDLMRDSLVGSNPDSDPYATLIGGPDIATFAFGKTVNQDLSTFSKSDLARAVLHTICHNTVSLLHANAVVGGYKHIFLGGGFCESKVTQDLVTHEHIFHRIRQSMFTGKGGDVDMIYLKYGSHLGAIGALFSQ